MTGDLATSSSRVDVPDVPDVPHVVRRGPVIPVVVIDDAADAVPLARALAAGGIGVIEITLRTPAALDALAAVVSDVPEVLAGAGTVVTPGQVEQVVATGARFLVTPGTTPALLEALDGAPLAVLPGAATVSESLLLAERGYAVQKFFPAEPSGGVAYLASLRGPLPGITFCPTGGITPATAPHYLALPNVPCVGGSWLTPSAAVTAGDWAAVTRLAREATLLANGGT